MEGVEWLSAAEYEMWRGYLDSTRLLLRALDRQLEVDAGISFADFEVLALLSEAPERRLRMSEIADAAMTTRSGVTRAVNRLADAGWLRRVECDEDKRGWYAELTEAGFAKSGRPRRCMWRPCDATCLTCSARATSGCSRTPTPRSVPTY